MNILHRINSELGGKFDVHQFFFHSYLDSYEGCIKNFLMSKVEQDVRIESIDETFHFEAFEPILVEESHKFTIKEIEKLA
jgi:L-histidine N-alpha-methyltransferase